MNIITHDEHFEMIDRIGRCEDNQKALEMVEELCDTVMVNPNDTPEKQQNSIVIQKWAHKLADCKTNEEVLEKAWTLEKGE